MLAELILAGRVAQAKGADTRNYRLGAGGVRGDGATVTAKNGTIIANGLPDSDFTFREAHAEVRLANKLDHDATVYVARVARNGELKIARPCPDCMQALRSRRVAKVYYTISDTEWGCFDFNRDVERVWSK